MKESSRTRSASVRRMEIFNLSWRQRLRLISQNATLWVDIRGVSSSLPAAIAGRFVSDEDADRQCHVRFEIKLLIPNWLVDEMR